MQDQECEEPAHHARRPMNAFLIFCKRHREIVRAKYPDLENRSITKILGEWWADLDKEEKACYTGLAKQYKDSFLSANPDFKWHKLQVGPPLRTLPSRVRMSTEKPIVSCNKYQDHELERTINNSTKFHYNNTSHNSIESPKSNREDSIRELQNALTETTRMFDDNFEEKERYGVVNDQMTNQEINDQMTNQDINDQIVDNRSSKDDDEHQRNWSEDDKNSISGSTCKRYQEVMAVGELIVNKRQRRDYPNKLSDEGYNASCSWDPGSSLEEFTVIMIDESNLNADYIQHDITIESEPNVEPNDTPEPDNNAKKEFRAADFDLEATIKTLPSLSLEEFEQKKLERKLKKKSMPVTHRIYGLRCYGKIVKKRKYNITYKNNKKRV